MGIATQDPFDDYLIQKDTARIQASLYRAATRPVNGGGWIRRTRLATTTGLWYDRMIMDGDAASQRTAHDLAAAAGRGLAARGWRLAVAESCTGGRLGDTVTNVVGSSAWFAGGIIAYADAVKIGLLGVPAAMLIEHGAVSAPVAAAMAAGARARTGADIALAVTGITGPGGGSPAKPVGTVYIGLATPSGVQTVHHRWSGDRDANKQASVVAALQMLDQYLAHEDERET